MLRLAMVRLCAESPQRYRIAHDARGKPVWQDGCGLAWPHFNISHSARLVVCALSSHPVGVDVESMQRPLCLESLAARCLHSSEAAWLGHGGAPRAQRRFLAMWTVKEACLKVNGEGLSQAMDQLQIRATARLHGRCLLPGAPGWHWQALRPVPGYLAVCSGLHPPAVERVVHCDPALPWAPRSFN
jgi:4'-phosphopantetheinyl transferase